MDSQDAPLKSLVDQVRMAASLKTALDIRGGGTKSFTAAPPLARSWIPAC